MKNCTFKRRYLIQNPKEVVGYLATTPSYKKAIHQLYLEKHPSYSDRFGVLTFHFTSLDQMKAFEADARLHILENVSDDKRYKNRYLSLFGLPLNYDFSLLDVFNKCQKIGLKELDFSFSQGMSTQKVLKVLLYREMQFLEHEVELLLDDHAKAVKNLSKIAENIRYILGIGSVVFDNTLVQCLQNSFEPFLNYDREALLKFVQSPLYKTLLLDMRFFLHEQSGFYLLPKSEMPLLSFVKKHLKKEEFRIAKRLKKALC